MAERWVVRGARAVVAVAMAASVLGAAPTVAEAAGSGHITGRVTAAATGAPLPGMCVQAVPVDPASGSGASTTSGADGTYDLAGLGTEDYDVRFDDCAGTRYRSEHAHDAVSLDSSVPVPVTDGATTAGIDAALDLLPPIPPTPGFGSIAGRVTAQVDGRPLAGVPVCVDTVGFCSSTSADGTYLVGGVPVGPAKVRFGGTADELGEWYHQKPDEASATPVTVVKDTTTPGIDAALQLGGFITGRVTADGSGASLPGICASTAEGSGYSASTAANGTYVIRGLRTGTYHVAFSDCAGTGYLSELWDGASTVGTANPVGVVAGQATAGVDGHLGQGGHLRGRVSGAVGGSPALAGVCVDAAGPGFGSTVTKADGTYDIGSLPTGDYRLTFRDCGDLGYEDEQWNNVPIGGVPTLVHVTAPGAVANLNASLAAQGGIRGRVTQQGSVSLLAGICVTASGPDVRSTTTSASGTYDLPRLASGSYTVRFSDCSSAHTYLDEYYDDAPDAGSATPVTVTAGTTTGNVNAALSLAGGVSGQVTAAAGGAGVGGVCVQLSRVGGGGSAFAQTAANGSYSVVGLRPGSYRVDFDPCATSRPLLGETYDDTLDDPFTPVVVTAGAATTSISASLARVGYLGGSVRADKSHRRLEDVCVRAHNTTHPGHDGATRSDAHGRYAFRDLAPGSYTIEYTPCGADSFTPEWFDDQPDESTATHLAVTPVAVLDGVDSGLSVPGEGGVGGDFSGDGRSDRALFRPATGTWLVDGFPPVAFGTAGDLPVPGDYDGDGTTDLAVFRPSNGRWYVRGVAGSVAFGTTGDLPVPADYDGDGRTDLAVFRPSTGRWYVQGAAAGVAFGTAGDVPVPARWLSPTHDTMAVFRPSTNRWYVLGGATTTFGTTKDVPVPADYDGDGLADLAVFRRSTGRWYTVGQPSVALGTSGDVPAPGRWDDDAPADRAVFRPSTTRWYVEGLPGSAPFGSSTDVVVDLPYAIARIL